MLKNLGLLPILLLSATLITAGATGCAGQKAMNMPIVLLTDFGVEDYRVPQLKGIIFNSNPEAKIVDASHNVPAFDVFTGAFMLDIAAREFPENVVFIGIIAPYTQPEPVYIVLTTTKNQVFVLPDNGLITYVAKNMTVKSIYRISNEKLFDKPIKELVAERVQGRVGALMAKGYQPNDAGTPLSSYNTFDVQEPVISTGKLPGTIVYIDHFGNAVTNISRKTADEYGLKPGDSIRLKCAQSEILAKFGTIYSDVSQGKEIVFVSNNLDMLQLSINLGNFADKYAVKAGTKLEIYRAESNRMVPKE